MQSPAAFAAATSVTVGGGHSCAIVDGGLQCWGNNTYGQLGNGNTTNSTSPVAIAGLASGVTQVSAGKNHTCAIVSSEVYCWGSNQDSQVGESPANAGWSVSVPKRVAGLTGATKVSAGGNFSCAIVGGALKCWGANLGIDPVTSSANAQLIAGLESGVTQIVAGSNSLCATSNGSARCVGINDKGQLGNGSTTSATSSVAVSGLSSGITGIAAGAGKQACAVNSNGAAICWGDNSYGQLGNGGTTPSTTPGGVTGLTSGVTAVTAGGSFSCAMVNSSVSCWGNNGAGQLGNGGNASSKVPVSIQSLGATATQIASGEYSSCALTQAGAVMCWGVGYGYTPIAISFGAAPASQDQTITFSSLDATKTLVVDSTFQLSASASSGLAVSFSTTPPSVCTVEGSTVTMRTQGTCVITASQAGNATYRAAPTVSQSVVFQLKTYTAQSIVWQGDLSYSLAVGATIPVTATATSGLPIVLSSLTPTICTVSNSKVIVVSAGRCEVWADQGGNDTYSATYDKFLVAIAIADTRLVQSLTLNLGGGTRSLYAGSTFQINPTASSGLAVTIGVQPVSVCSISGTTITVVGAGSCLVHVYQGGDARYLPIVADSAIALTILQRKDQVLTLTYPPSVNMRAGEQFSISGSIQSGLPISMTALSPTICTLTQQPGQNVWSITVGAEGLCTFRATQAGNTEYSPASRDGGTNIILVVDQTITYAVPGAVQTMVGDTFVVKATASSGLAVTITSQSPSVCTVSGTNVKVLASGNCSLQFYQGGTAVIKPRTESANVTVTASATPIAPTITVTGNGSADVGAKMEISVNAPQTRFGYQLFWRSSNEQYDASRSAPIPSGSLAFDMAQGLDLYVVVRASLNGIQSEASNEIRVRSTTPIVQPDLGGWQSARLGVDYEPERRIGNKNPVYIFSSNRTGVLKPGDLVQVSAGATDTDSPRLTFVWYAVGGGMRSINADNTKIEWKAPDQPGVYLLRGAVYDGHGGSDGAYFIFVVR